MDSNRSYVEASLNMRRSRTEEHGTAIGSLGSYWFVFAAGVRSPKPQPFVHRFIPFLPLAQEQSCVSLRRPQAAAPWAER
jgi:hypothetical protein